MADWRARDPHAAAVVATVAWPKLPFARCRHGERRAAFGPRPMQPVERGSPGALRCLCNVLRTENTQERESEARDRLTGLIAQLASDLRSPTSDIVLGFHCSLVWEAWMEAIGTVIRGARKTAVGFAPAMAVLLAGVYVQATAIDAVASDGGGRHWSASNSLERLHGTDVLEGQRTVEAVASLSGVPRLDREPKSVSLDSVRDRQQIVPAARSWLSMVGELRLGLLEAISGRAMAFDGVNRSEEVGLSANHRRMTAFEPGTLVLLGAGLIGLAGIRKGPSRRK